jgi:hypothetical protein
VEPLLAWLRENKHRQGSQHSQRWESVNFLNKTLIATESLRKIDPENPEFRHLLLQLAAAKEIPGLKQGEVLILSQQASRILARLKGLSQ